jgi:uncharacterized protein (TIGR03118 family)
VLLAAGVAASAGRSDDGPLTLYTVTNLVSDGSIPAVHTDANLVNGWGITAGPNTPWWVADNGTDRSTLYNGDGVAQPAPPAGPLVVSVDGGPTGTVFNSTGDFPVTDGAATGAARFLFASEDGKIRGWNPTVPPPPPSHTAFVIADRSDVGAVYKGLAIGSVGTSNFLYATDFHNARIDVFDKNDALVPMPGRFRDFLVPPGYAPFGIQNIAGNLFVTYAKQQKGSDDEAHGTGLGIVDEYTTDGRLIARVAAHGLLNAPWGLAWAPADFGRFSGDLLVGNFGSGRIEAYAPTPPSSHVGAFGHFRFAGQLMVSPTQPLVIDGLWGIGFGNGNASGATNALYFAAGPNDEANGLLGRVTAG